MAGDYNLDLLRCDSSAAIGDFFDLICSLGTFPKITLPTRLTSHSCTLIDNFFCKHSNVFSELKAGILIHKLSDHQPYFLSIPFKYCHVSTVKSSSDSSVNGPYVNLKSPYSRRKLYHILLKQIFLPIHLLTPMKIVTVCVIYYLMPILLLCSPVKA